MPTIPTLSGSYIDQTYQRLVQVSGSSFADGLGTPITLFSGTSSYATYATNANYASTAGNSSTTDNVNNYSNASIEQINVGEVSTGTYSYIVRSEELEQSKYSTHNIFNFTNFT